MSAGDFRPYFTLLVKFEGETDWTPEFGSYEASEALQEAEDSYDDSETKVICTDEDQASINEVVRVYNIKF